MGRFFHKYVWHADAILFLLYALFAIMRNWYYPNEVYSYYMEQDSRTGKPLGDGSAFEMLTILPMFTLSHLNIICKIFGN